MYDEYELNLLDAEGELIAPLDQIEPLTDESEVEKPDVELMLVLLENPSPNNGC